MTRLWIELPWSENPANTYAQYTETLDSCFDLIRSHQQCNTVISTSGDQTSDHRWQSRNSTTKRHLCVIWTDGSVVEFWLCNLWLLVWSPEVDIMVYHCWWNLMRLKQLFSVSICCALEFTRFSGHANSIYNIIPLLKKKNVEHD